ncbi:hypothetical protein [Flavobacterium sp. LC2016-12]|uniref:hypothetical protein n=1 Tax=Flavobacterium sp. LC2016-12 TaxID=2783794 RepID=UPI00188DA8F2|nr:hypothetical protein [Flavobacterium sp. LC2016-12]MBF4465426.1 hypothetical protein [Flavobacterium sp. LC2016-12]
MKNILIILFCFFFISSNKLEENLELRIYNNSKFKIEKLKLKYNGQETEFKNIEPKSYSEIKKIKGLWEDNCYDLTVFKKKLFRENFWAHQICFPIDDIGNNKIESGKYILSLKIKQTEKDKVEVESEYIIDKKTSETN